MGSPPTDVLLLNGVAAIVKDLAEFIPIRELFRTHITRWQEKNALIVANRCKAEAQLVAFGRQKPKTANPAGKEWPVRLIHALDFSSSELVPIPPELYRKVQKRVDPNRYHLFRALDKKRDLTRTECFTMLAGIHDAAYQKCWIAYAEGYIVYVAEATKILAEGLSQVAVENLATLVERVLDQIEALPDSKSTNETGKTRQQIIQRSRKKLADLVIHSHQHFVTHTDLESVHDAVLKLGSDVKASHEAQGRWLAQQIQIQIEADRQRPQQTETGGRGGKRRSPKKGPAHRPPDTDAKDDARIGDRWLTGRNSREFLAYGDLARKLGRGETEIREAIDRDRKRRPEVWRAKRRTARRNKSVKRA